MASDARIDPALASVERKKRFRRWHAWMGVTSAIFMATLGVTAILLEAPRAWRLGDVTVSSRWFPGYQAVGVDRILTQVKCGIVMADGTAYIGTRKGLFAVRGGQIDEILETHGKDIFNIDAFQGRLLVGTRDDAWVREPDGQWLRAAGMKGAVTFADDGRIIFNRGLEGLLITDDLGKTSTPLSGLNEALRHAQYPGDVTLSQLALDLHTGYAIFGATAEAWYVYAVSAVLIGLALSGFLIRPTYLRWRRTAPAPRTVVRRAS